MTGVALLIVPSLVGRLLLGVGIAGSFGAPGNEASISWRGLPLRC
jgi:hypothetical protein